MPDHTAPPAPQAACKPASPRLRGQPGPASRRCAAVAALTLCGLALSACQGGEYAGLPAGTGAGPGVDGGDDPNSLFQSRVQPRLAFCRTCHVTGGVADTADGRRFLLSPDGSDDYARTRAAWVAMGEGVEGSLLLAMPAGTAPRAHSGGRPWPPGSDAYASMQSLLRCWSQAGQCGQGGDTPAGDDLKLLGSTHGGHAWFDFCSDQPDSAALPIDPRALIQPGINAGRAVLFNAYWKDCHVEPERVGEFAHPATCGELRASRERGRILMEGNGVLGQASTFAGHDADGAIVIEQEAFNNLWLVWGLAERPDNFDELMAERYGTSLAPERNPYPLPGEDPNASDGGSGQLPVGWLQTRDPDSGAWTGKISTNCQGCHSTTAGSELIVGGGSSLLDAGVAGRDMALAGSPAGAAIERLAGRVRGTSNAQFSNLTALAGAQDPSIIEVLMSGSTATGDTPAWWNVGSRPLKFVDGMFPGDAVRVDFALFIPLLGDKFDLPDYDPQVAYDWVRRWVQDGDHYIMSIKAPAYPLPIDQALARQGAVLFHAKDLWAAGLNNPVPRPPGGNGSCASCHGVYSPYYAEDPAFLEDPRLAGLAGYITPIEIIDTDAARLAPYSEATNRALSNSFVGYPETADSAQDCRVQNLPELRGDRPVQGYGAPPLHGIWATASYFHNGAVPNVWQVLEPSSRPEIWRRLSKPARADQDGLVVMGFDTDLGRAYDPERMGWRYEELACGAGTLPYLSCTPADPLADEYGQLLLGQSYANLVFAWNATIPPGLSNAQIEERKIFNTRMYSQGNGGHAFSAVLTDGERRAIIEFLKTL